MLRVRGAARAGQAGLGARAGLLGGAPAASLPAEPERVDSRAAPAVLAVPAEPELDGFQGEALAPRSQAEWSRGSLREPGAPLELAELRADSQPCALQVQAAPPAGFRWLLGGWLLLYDSARGVLWLPVSIRVLVWS